MNAIIIGINWVLRYIADKQLADSIRPFLSQFISQRDALFGAQFWYELLKVDTIRYLVTGIRLHYFTSLSGGTRIHEPSQSNPDIADNAIKWNFQAIQEFTCLHGRIKTLFLPMMGIQSISENSRILVVGPRVEDDLLLLKAHGYHNFRGLDIMSYSPWVDLGDMHQMPYEDSSFDVVLFPWVLVYSRTPGKAALEAIRVVKKNGFIGIGAEHQPNYDREDYKKKAIASGGFFVDGLNINTANEHLSLFNGSVRKVFYMHDVGEHITDAPSNTAVIFSVDK